MLTHTMHIMAKPPPPNIPTHLCLRPGVSGSNFYAVKNRPRRLTALCKATEENAIGVICI